MGSDCNYSMGSDCDYNLCCGCGLKVHSSTLCGKSLDTLLIDRPCLVGRTLPGGRVISEGADNEMHCMCFACIGKMMTAGCMDVTAARKENIANGSNPIENCLWDDIVVTTTLTNAVSRTKKGESLKATNATRFQGFRINDELIPNASIVKDHICRDGPSEKTNLVHGGLQSSHFARPLYSGKGSTADPLPKEQ